MNDSPINEATTAALEPGESFRCDPPHAVDAEQIQWLQQESLPPEKAQRMAEFFGLLADANRLRILSALARQEWCVGNLALAMGMSESAVSHQLRTLRALRLVSYRKQGRHVFYRLQDHQVPHSVPRQAVNGLPDVAL